MKALDLTPEQAPQVLAAMRHVATIDGGVVHEQEHAMLVIYAELLRYDSGLDALPELALEALALSLPEPEHRAALVQRLVIMAMLDGKVGAAQIAATRAIAKYLGVREPAIHQLEMFLAGRLKLLTFDIMRRSFIASKVKRIWRDEGFAGMAKLAKQARGKPDSELAKRYLVFAELPVGTLGRELYEHFRRSGFALPGEQGSAPEALLFHDLGHVLTGYSTDPEGEVAVAGFEAGYMGEDGFSITLLALYLFHLGADINPTAKPSKGRFSVEAFRAAWQRGAGVREDLRYWDPWPHVERNLEDVKRELRVVDA